MAEPQKDESADQTQNNRAQVDVQVPDGQNESEADARVRVSGHTGEPIDPTTRRARAREAAAAKKAAAKEAALKKTPKKLKNPTNLQVRFRTGLVYTLVSVICVLVNDITTVAYLSLVSAVCAGEFYYMMRSDAKLPNETVGVITAVLYPISMWMWGLPGALLVCIASMVALLIWYVYWMRARIPDVGVSFFGAAYTGLMISGLIVIRQSLPEPWGGVLLLLLFCSVWFNDAMAYLVGSRIGKHKLAPRTSPKKSWEGFIAGLLTSALFWFFMIFIPGVTLSAPQAIFYGLVVGGMGVVGDLAESRIKRNVGVKDSGTIMPGHGGLLDRCDSLFMASVAAVVLLVYGGGIPYVW